MVFGCKITDGFAPIMMNNSPVDYVKRQEYLGVILEAGPELKFIAKPDLSSFRKAANAILCSSVCSQEHITLSLLYTYCVPIVTYACAVKEFSPDEMREIHVAMNKATRKIYNYNLPSVRVKRKELGIKCIYTLFTEAKTKFNLSVKSSLNSVVKHLSTVI